MASGALPSAKGDVRVQGRYRIEAKLTEGPSYRLQRAVLEKIVREAQRQLEIPVLRLSFVAGPRTLLDLAITKEKPVVSTAPRMVLPGAASVSLPRTALEDCLGRPAQFFVVFGDPKTGDKSWYRITRWSDFLASMQKTGTTEED